MVPLVLTHSPFFLCHLRHQCHCCRSRGTSAGAASSQWAKCATGGVVDMRPLAFPRADFGGNLPGMAPCKLWLATAYLSGDVLARLLFSSLNWCTVLSAEMLCMIHASFRLLRWKSQYTNMYAASFPAHIARTNERPAMNARGACLFLSSWTLARAKLWDDTMSCTAVTAWSRSVQELRTAAYLRSYHSLTSQTRHAS